MRAKLLCWMSWVLLAMLPLGVHVEEDSTETNLQFMASSGQYAYIVRGCDDEVLHSEPLALTEYNVAIDHKTASPIRIGIQASYLRTEIEGESE